jgi:hypothetical protein
MRSPSPAPLTQVVAAHGGELAVIRRLLEEAAREAIKLYRPWKRLPKGTALSAMTRDRFLELAEDCEELAGGGVVVKSCGEDWVRVWLPGPGWIVSLRSRPKVISVEEEGGLFDLDLFGAPRGTPVLFWRFNAAEDRLASFSMARVADMAWVLEAEVLEEVEITDGLTALISGRVTVPGSGNDDDDLENVVGRWDNDEPLSEAEVADEIYEDDHDDERGPALGENNS